MKKIIFLGVSFLIILAAILIYFNSTSKNQESAKLIKVKIAYYPITHFLPLYLAVEKGYFKDAGIDVELVKFESPNQTTDAIMNGQVDFTGPGAALGITGIANFKDPGKLKIYAVSGDAGKSSGHSFVLPKDSKITSIEQLKGKKLGIWAGTIQWRTIARDILAKNGLDMDKDLTIVELAPAVQVQALTSGQVDALLTLEPIPTTVISKDVGKILMTSPANKFIADPFWYGVGVVNSQFAEKNPEITARVIDIMNRSIDEVNQNFDANRKYLKGYTSLTEDLINSVPSLIFKSCQELGNQDKESISKFFDIFTKYKVVNGAINLNEMLYCK